MKTELMTNRGIRYLILLTLLVATLIAPANAQWDSWQNLGEPGSSLVSGISMGNGTAFYADAWNCHGYRITNYGSNWTDIGPLVNCGSPDYDGFIQYGIGYAGNGIAVLSDYKRNILRTTNYGANWTNLGPVFGADHYTEESIPYVGNGTFIAVGAGGGVYYGTGYGLNWSKVSTIPSSYSFESDLAYSSNGTLVMGDDNGNLWRSTNLGLNWTNVLTCNSGWIAAVSFGDGVFIATCNIHGNPGRVTVYRSTDDGQTWTNVTVASGTFQYTNIVYMSSGIFLFGSFYGDNHLFRTLDYGLTWQDLGNIIPGASMLQSSFVNVGNGTLLLGDSNGYLFKSTGPVPTPTPTPTPTPGDLINTPVGYGKYISAPFDASINVSFASVQLNGTINHDEVTLYTQYSTDDNTWFGWARSNYTQNMYAVAPEQYGRYFKYMIIAPPGTNVTRVTIYYITSPDGVIYID